MLRGIIESGAGPGAGRRRRRLRGDGAALLHARRGTTCGRVRRSLRFARVRSLPHIAALEGRGTQQPAGHAEMAMSSSVVTINVRSQSGEPVSNLNEPIRVLLALQPAVRTCSVAYGSSGADDESRQCMVPSEPSCSYLDTQSKEWRLDGVVVNRMASSVVCEFTHLTDFAVCLGPPPRANAVASLGETFDLASFASDNAAGLVMCLMLLVIVVVAGVRSARRHLRRIADAGQGIDDTASQYVKDLNMPWFDKYQGYSHVRFNKYAENKKMALHADHIHSMFDGERKGVPILSVLGLLNDDFEGGEFFMIDKQREFSKGDILIFPSNFIYPHVVKPVTKGIRYSFISWIW